MSTLYLIRHAHARDRSAWDGDDQERPLSEKGLRQAKNLRKVLVDVGVGRLISSPATRCVQTLEPVAKDLGLPVETRIELREGTDPTRMIALMEEVAFD